MKRENWPETDRALWEAAFEEGDICSDGGARADHRGTSNFKAEKGYGRWLTFLKFTGLLRPDAHPAHRITADSVKAYVAHLIDLKNSTSTQLARLQELLEVAKVLDPCRDWSFINRLASRVRSMHKPARDKRETLVCSVELSDLGLDLMATAASAGTRRQQAVAYRDGLMIALSALQPYRRRNLAGLVLEDTLQRFGDNWLITFPGEAMKNGDPREDDWPDPLVAHLEEYLSVYRPYLAGLKGRWTRDLNGALWVSTDGSPMTETALYGRIRARTKAHFGVAINPHSFRYAAATTWAIEDPESVRAASSLLGHRGPQVTERSYQMARSLEAGRTFAATLERRRNRGLDPSEE